MVTTEAFQDPHKETVGWENFLGMTIGQAVVWASQNIDPKEINPELTTSEPYVMGSHATCSGAWASGPEDYAPAEYQWGYNRMMTVDGLFGAGDAIGGTAHKFSSGSFTEGRIAAKAAVKYVNDLGKEQPQISEAEYEGLKKTVYQPMENYEVGRNEIVAGTVSPSYLLPIHGLQRLEKIMDEYVGGIGAFYTTNEPLLTRGLELLSMLKEDLDHLGAEDLHQLQRAWELQHRVLASEASHSTRCSGRKRVGRAITIVPIIPSWTTRIGIASPCPATTDIRGSGRWRRLQYITSSIDRAAAQLLCGVLWGSSSMSPRPRYSAHSPCHRRFDLIAGRDCNVPTRAAA